MPMAGSPALETTVVYKTAGQPAVGSERVNTHLGFSLFEIFSVFFIDLYCQPCPTLYRCGTNCVWLVG